MDHGFGGMFMIRILIVFVFIYIMFIGIALNIAKVYRIKNGVINILEQEQFSGPGDESRVLGNDTRLTNYLADIPYVVYPSLVEKHCKGATGQNEWNDYSTGVCIIRKGSSDSYHFKVYVYMVVDFPLFGLNKLHIPVSGETVSFS